MKVEMILNKNPYINQGLKYIYKNNDYKYVGNCI